MAVAAREQARVSMKSGLEDRNNPPPDDGDNSGSIVSMKSGLEDRNNRVWPDAGCRGAVWVSMKSGLEDRNNPFIPKRS